MLESHFLGVKVPLHALKGLVVLGADHEQIFVVLVAKSACSANLPKDDFDIARVRVLLEEGVNSKRDIVLIQVELEPWQCHVLAFLFGGVEVGINSFVQGFASYVGERAIR